MVSLLQLTDILTLTPCSIKPKVTWNLFKNNVQNLLAHVVFPLLCLTREDLELWDEDPVEYIHKKIGSSPALTVANFRCLRRLPHTGYRSKPIPYHPSK
jgi:hypothetical protein